MRCWVLDLCFPVCFVVKISSISIYGFLCGSALIDSCRIEFSPQLKRLAVLAAGGVWDALLPWSQFRILFWRSHRTCFFSPFSDPHSNSYVDLYGWLSPVCDRYLDFPRLETSPLFYLFSSNTQHTSSCSSKAHDDKDLPIFSPHTIASCCWVILFTSHEPSSHHNNNYWHQQIASHHHRAPSNHFSFHRPSCCHQHPPWGRLPRPISTPILFALVAVLHAIRISLNNNKEETNNHNNHES